MNGLIVKPPWSQLILDGVKIMELRGNNTKIRGTIGIIESGTGKVFGTVDLVDCIKLSDEDFKNSVSKHRVNPNDTIISYKNLYGWIFENPIRFDKPIPYVHKQGCVIWVHL